ncbi:hypothetical protein VP1G_09644 [Cytospora mali]|uniref:Uncharacterized protein n=1 Tax=Cytospora mali TaxID=578113 RepID=A0A194VFG8_CYTMA|nr:hypothetical protein VP1G_09644 [Valsa mali var. pyri (nom. inval.)]
MDEIEETITPAVRQYSFEVQQENPTDTLSQALGSQVKKHDSIQALARQQILDWNTWLISKDITDYGVLEPLQRQRKVLIDTWQTFGHLFANGEGSVNTQDEIPTIATLYRAVEEAQLAWDSHKRGRFGRSKGCLLAFMETLDDHSFLFQFIPTGDKYVSLITGVVASIVKRKTEIFDSAEMRRLLVDLYVQIFGFLCYAMSWYTSKRKRARASLNKNFYDKTFKPTVDKIQQTVKGIRDEAKHITEIRIGEMYDGVKRLEDQMLALRNTGNMNRHDDTQQILRRLDDIGGAFDALGSSSVKALVAVENHVAYSQNTVVNQNSPSAVSSGSKSSEEIGEEVVDSGAENEDGLAIENDAACTRYEIQQLTVKLTKFAEDDRHHISDSLRGVTRAHLPAEVMIELKRWIKATDSKFVWVEGPPSNSHGSSLSLAAIRISDISMQAGIPCLSIFIKAHYDLTAIPGPRITQREAATVALLYSFIYQLSRLLPAEFEPMDEFTQEQFGLLDGSLGSANVALKIIEALITHSPPSLICIIDGLDLAESQNTIQHLSGLIRILRSEEKKRMLKVCFTTNGNSMVLIRKIGVFERVDASRMAQEDPRGFMRGAFDINELGDPT